MTFKELQDLLRLNLIPSDIKKLRILLRPIDFYNIRALWLGQPFDERGNFGAKELEEALLVRDGFLPSYLDEYLDRYETTRERLTYFPSLIASLFREVEDTLSGFLRQYYDFERERMFILTALRAKQTGRDIVRELQFEDPFDPFIANILVQKDASDFVPPQEFEDFENLICGKRTRSRKIKPRPFGVSTRKDRGNGRADTSRFQSIEFLDYVARYLYCG